MHISKGGYADEIKILKKNTVLPYRSMEHFDSIFQEGYIDYEDAALKIIKHNLHVKIRQT